MSIHQLALADNIPTLAKIKRTYGEKDLKAFICFELTEMASFFNLQLEFNLKQIAQTADLILSLYSHLKYSDIGKCLECGKSGLYGKLYGKLDGQIVLDWFRQYDSVRLEAIIEARAAEGSQFKNQILNPILGDVIKVTEKPKPKNEVTEESENNKRIQDWIREFDTLSNQQGTIRFVELNGLNYNIDEFLIYKMKQL